MRLFLEWCVVIQTIPRPGFVKFAVVVWAPLLACGLLHAFVPARSDDTKRLAADDRGQVLAAPEASDLGHVFHS